MKLTEHHQKHRPLCSKRCRSITLRPSGVCHALSEPFYVFATQNPIEMEGTYPLPEAQLDRFMFNVWIDYLPEDQEVAVVRQTTTTDPEPIQQIFQEKI